MVLDQRGHGGKIPHNFFFLSLLLLPSSWAGTEIEIIPGAAFRGRTVRFEWNYPTDHKGFDRNKFTRLTWRRARFGEVLVHRKEENQPQEPESKRALPQPLNWTHASTCSQCLTLALDTHALICCNNSGSITHADRAIVVKPTLPGNFNFRFWVEDDTGDVETTPKNVRKDHTHAHTHTHSLSLTHTHTHTHTYSFMTVFSRCRCTG